MAPRPRNTTPPSPPITLPPRGSGKGGTTTPTPTPTTPSTLPQRGSGKGAALPQPSSPTTFLENLQAMPQEELIAKLPMIQEDISESERKRQKAVAEYEARLTQAQRNALKFAEDARKAGVSEERIQEVLGGREDPRRGFLGPIQDIYGAVSGTVSDVAKTIGKLPLPSPSNLVSAIPGVPGEPTTIGDAFGIGKATVTPILNPALKIWATANRYWIGTLQQIGQELDVLTGAKKRGEMTYYPLPPELREKIGPGGIFRGGPKGREALLYPQEEAGKAGFDLNELIETGRNPQTGVGYTLWRDVTGNPFIDQGVGFLGEVFTDPLNLFTAGAGGTAPKAAARLAGLSPEAFAAAKAASKFVSQQAKLALKREAVKELLEQATKAADAATVAKAQKELAQVTKELDKISRKVAGDAAPRVSGRTGAEALGLQLQGIRDAAEATVARVGSTADAPFGAISPEQAALARYTLEVITPEVIANASQKGFASFIPSLFDSFRRTPSEAASILGVRGGVSIRNPLEVFGGPGRARYTLPGSELITNPAGKLISSAFGGIRGSVPRSVLEAATPSGEGGLFPEGLAALRVRLRNAENLDPKEVKEIRDLLNLNRRFSGRKVLERKNALSLVNRFNLVKERVIGKAGGFKVNDLKQGMRWLNDSAGFQAEKAAGRISKEVEDAYNALRGFFDEAAREADEVTARTGFKVRYRLDYAPQILSQEAKRLLRRSPKLNRRLKQEFGYDRTWFVGNWRERTLTPGTFFFGFQITEDTLKKGIGELNKIARRKVHPDGSINPSPIKFDFFEEDPLKIISTYANSHADFLALQKVLGEAPDVAPESFAREQFTILAPKTFDPAEINNYADNFGFELASLTDDPAKIDQIDLLVDSVRNNLTDISRRLGRGEIDDATAKVESDLVFKEHALLGNLVLANKADTAFDMTTKRFTDSAEIIKKGWEELASAPAIFANPQVQQLFKGLETIEDVTKRKAWLNMYNDTLTFAKAWYVARPGFATRNLQSNIYMMSIAAGAETGNLAQGLQIFKAMQKGVKAGKTIEEVAADVVKRGLADSEEQVLNAIAFYGSAGFGRFGEIAREVGDAVGRGITQLGPARGIRIPGTREAAEGTVKRRVGDAVETGTRAVSEGIGAYPRAIRAASENLEEMTRFQLMWDGIKRGLTPEQAAARVQYYLIDYSDISKLDKYGKMVFPFWMWMTRNTPLQMQLMYTSPRGPLLIEKFRRATEDEEETARIPQYLRRDGAYETKEMEGFGRLISGQRINPALPVFGFGEQNLLERVVTDPKGFIANLTPLPRVVIEAINDKQYGLGKRPISQWGDSEMRENVRKVEYGLRETFGVPLSTFKSWVALVPPLRRVEAIQYLFQIGIDEAAPWDQATSAAARLAGLQVEPTTRTLEFAQEQERIQRELERISKQATEEQSKKQQDRLKKLKEEAEKRLEEIKKGQP